MAVWRKAVAGAPGLWTYGQRSRVAHRPTAAEEDAAYRCVIERTGSDGLPTPKPIQAVPLRGSTSVAAAPPEWRRNWKRNHQGATMPRSEALTEVRPHYRLDSRPIPCQARNAAQDRTYELIAPKVLNTGGVPAKSPLVTHTHPTNGDSPGFGGSPGFAAAVALVLSTISPWFHLPLVGGDPGKATTSAQFSGSGPPGCPT
jgi:hypothetical protein